MSGLPERARKGEPNCDEFERQLELGRSVYVRLLQIKLAPERREGAPLSDNERLHVLDLLDSLRRLGRRKRGSKGRGALDLCAAIESELLECHGAHRSRSGEGLWQRAARHVRPFPGWLRSRVARWAWSAF